MEVIAECGHNHGGSVTTALRLIEAAGQAGADAVKFQKRDNASLYTRPFLDAAYHSENAFGPTYGEHRDALEFHSKYEWRLLKVAAEDAGCRFYATAFDFESVDFLMNVGIDGLKIASGDITNTPLLTYATSTGLPLYVSTGACGIEDVQRAVDTVLAILPTFTLFHCTASYPCDYSELDLGVLSVYQGMFPEVSIGLSDHANAIWPSLVAQVLGAAAVEKHFTLDRTSKGTDHNFSLEPQGLAKLVRDLRRCESSMGTEKALHDSEIPARVKMGKGLYAASNLPAQKVLTRDDIAIKSPGGFLEPYQLQDLIGLRLVRPLQSDEPITEKDVDGFLDRSGSGVLHVQERS